MKVRFWGTRGSLPKPGPTTLRYGGNTACVEFTSAAGTRIIVDCGSGAHDLGQALLATGRRPLKGHILISHTHWDHIQGLPFFAPLFTAHNEWEIYGPHGLGHSIREVLAGQMQYTYFPITLQHFEATVRYHDLVEGVFRIGDITVRSQYLNHPALTLGYRLEADGVAVVYACDHEPHAPQLAAGCGELGEQDRHHADFLADADLVIHDAQYTAAEYAPKVGWGHSTVEYAMHVCRVAKAKRLALTHHDPLRDDDALDRIVAAAQRAAALPVFAAAEGQTIELEAKIGLRATSGARAFPAEPPVLPGLLRQSILLGVLDAAIAGSIAEALSACNIAVVRAADGAAALQLLASERPSVVVLEQHPPAMDALGVCRALRSAGHTSAQVPVLVVAAPDEIASEDAPGVSDWLIKPFSEVYARTKLQAWLMRTACRWMRPPVPTDEQHRLTALHQLGVLDTAPEDRFDRITRRAAELFDVPIALVSLVDRDRQWFKSCYGLEARESSRETSFCAHAILGDGIMIVPDTLLDDRFADNPFVTGEPRIRFYAGYPLIHPDSSCLGTLCIVDTRPRGLDDREIGLLRELGAQAQQELVAAPPPLV